MHLLVKLNRGADREPRKGCPPGAEKMVFELRPECRGRRGWEPGREGAGWQGAGHRVSRPRGKIVSWLESSKGESLKARQENGICKTGITSLEP